MTQELAALHCSVPTGGVDFEVELELIRYLAEVDHIKVDIRHMIQKKISRIQLDLTTPIPRSSVNFGAPLQGEILSCFN